MEPGECWPTVTLSQSPCTTPMAGKPWQTCLPWGLCKRTFKWYLKNGGNSTGEPECIATEAYLNLYLDQSTTKGDASMGGYFYSEVSKQALQSLCLNSLSGQNEGSKIDFFLKYLRKYMRGWVGVGGWVSGGGGVGGGWGGVGVLNSIFFSSTLKRAVEAGSGSSAAIRLRMCSSLWLSANLTTSQDLVGFLRANTKWVSLSNPSRTSRLM